MERLSPALRGKRAGRCSQLRAPCSEPPLLRALPHCSQAAACWKERGAPCALPPLAAAPAPGGSRRQPALVSDAATRGVSSEKSGNWGAEGCRGAGGAPARLGLTCYGRGEKARCCPGAGREGTSAPGWILESGTPRRNGEKQPRAAGFGVINVAKEKFGRNSS